MERKIGLHIFYLDITIKCLLFCQNLSAAQVAYKSNLIFITLYFRLYGTRHDERIFRGEF